ncbi:hypothetical protein V1477_002987 [Vespula maculifrons]|uniref:Uncharacterized protein n=1 Tax=Vespula maculifrons TaxID=7453 RepID=A0ABD2CUV8_VESMC
MRSKATKATPNETNRRARLQRVARPEKIIAGVMTLGSIIPTLGLFLITRSCAVFLRACAYAYPSILCALRITET